MLIRGKVLHCHQVEAKIIHPHALTNHDTQFYEMAGMGATGGLGAVLRDGNVRSLFTLLKVRDHEEHCRSSEGDGGGNLEDILDFVERAGGGLSCEKAERMSEAFPAKWQKNVQALRKISLQLRVVKARKICGTDTDWRAEHSGRRDCMTSDESPEERAQQPRMTQTCCLRRTCRELGGRKLCTTACEKACSQ